VWAEGLDHGHGGATGSDTAANHRVAAVRHKQSLAPVISLLGTAVHPLAVECDEAGEGDEDDDGEKHEAKCGAAG
jgi:hypothetical protein